MIYLASPYSAKKPDGTDDIDLMEQRFDAVCRKAGELMLNGNVVYSPIAHCHPIAVRVDLPRDWSFWGKLDRDMLSWASRFIVLKLDGWEQSIGVRAETEIAKSMGLLVEYAEP